MSLLTCSYCCYDSHFSEFKVGSHMEDSDDDDIDHRLEVDDFQCPKCGSCDVVQD